MFDPAKLAMNAEVARDVASVVGKRDEDFVLELKLDGIRILAHVTEDGVETYTRPGNRQTGKLPKIEAELAANLPVGTWVDGEVVSLRIREDGSVEHHWGGASSVIGSNVDKAARMSDGLTYSVFDVLAVGGTDARSLPFANRRSLLETAFDKDGWESVILTPQMAPTDDALAAMIDAGFEGAILKRLSAPYASGRRGFGWSKLKATDTVDAVIVGYQPGRGKYEGQLGALLLGQYDESGALVEIAKASGMTDAVRLAMSQNPDRYIGAVVEFAFMGRMDGGSYRHPQFKRLREDKDASECVFA